MEAQGRQWKRPAGEVPKGPIEWTHGDFQHRNLLWEYDQVAAVLDWDRMGIRPYAGELAHHSRNYAEKAGERQIFVKVYPPARIWKTNEQLSSFRSSPPSAGFRRLP